jgi:competence protein ComEC
MKQKLKLLLWALTMTLLLGGCGTEKVSETYAERGSVTETVNATEATQQITESETQQITETETQPALQPELKAYFLDEGQADCTILESNKHFMLVDAGNNDDADYILNYLNTLGVEKLDYVIGTHPHEDHIGSLDAVINNYEIGTLIMPEKAHNTKTFEDVVTAIENKGLSITPPTFGSSYTLGSATFSIITPNEDYGDDLNNWSVGIKIVSGDASIVMCGDAEEEAEQKIVETGVDLKADILKIGHHGSSTSSSTAFLDAVSPKYAIIMCGEGNDYGHPHQETLDKLSERGIEVFRTDEQGVIIANNDIGSWTWNTAPVKISPETESETLAPETETQVQTETEKVTEPPETDPPESQASGVIVHITETGEKYHSAGCQYLRKSDIEISLEDAKSRGYTPCSKCGPPQ